VADVEGRDIVIAMLQSIVSRRYGSDVLGPFGTVVVDEAHHISAEKYSQTLPLVAARHMLALSGTPERRDGCEVMLSHFIGPVTFQVMPMPARSRYTLTAYYHTNRFGASTTDRSR
ncbi:Hypothetical protein UVM_LOCUS99, partial [uncultured virus]